MIPADHWHDNGDGTAWLIVRKCPEPRGQQSMHTDCNVGMTILDRPCGTCRGTEVAETEHGIIDPSDGSVIGVETVIHACPDCIYGRHTFTISVDRNALPMRDGIHIGRDITVRISVVPGMVLPIYDWCPDEKPADHICHAWQGGRQSDLWWQHRSFDHEDWTERQITLPPAARPGMWAVLVKVAP